MASTYDNARRDEVRVRSQGDVSTEESIRSAVSWSAIIAGAVAATAATVILLVLGAGVGLSVISPWYGAGASAETVGVSAVVWLVVVQWVSSGLGGSLAGRLRTKWVGVHTHEVFFRDTAHGFLAWSLAAVGGALVFASVTAWGIGGVAKGTSDVAAASASGAAQAGVQNGHVGAGDGSAYFVDSMFRSSTNFVDGDKTAPRAEATRILVRNIQDGKVVLSPADKAYMAQMVAARTDLSQREAEQRVDTVVNQLNDAGQKARQAADVARKRAARLSIATALSMLIGAFIASAAAAHGGRIRDES
ncbi:MAG: hypothetical protein WBG11_12590 [Methylocella sp.]